MQTFKIHVDKKKGKPTHANKENKMEHKQEDKRANEIIQFILKMGDIKYEKSNAS